MEQKHQISEGLANCIYDSLMTFMSIKDDILTDPKTKTDPRKRLKILDEWHRIWGTLMRSTKYQLAKSVFMSIYNMLTNTIVYGFNTLDELNIYLNTICILLKTACVEYA